jgi:hypothetical protein
MHHWLGRLAPNRRKTAFATASLSSTSKRVLTNMTKYPYSEESRLQDVLGLIQVLAYSPMARRTQTGLSEELKRSPSGKNWMELAKEHPEFFRVREETGKSAHVSLIARNAQQSVREEDGDLAKPVLSADVANKLMELAVELHDKESQRRNLWKATVLPIVVAVIAATAAVTAAIITALARAKGVA